MAALDITTTTKSRRTKVNEDIYLLFFLYAMKIKTLFFHK